MADLPKWWASWLDTMTYCHREGKYGYERAARDVMARRLRRMQAVMEGRRRQRDERERRIMQLTLALARSTHDQMRQAMDKLYPGTQEQPITITRRS